MFGLTIFAYSQVRPGRSIHEQRWHEISYQVGTARSTELHAIQLEVRCVGLRRPHVGGFHLREDALRPSKEHRGRRASAARYNT